MFALSELESIKAIPDPLVISTAIPEAENSVFPPNYIPETQDLKEITKRIEHDIIPPILESRVENIELTVNRSLIPFQTQLTTLNRIMFSRRQSREDIPAVAEIEDFLFEKIRQFIIEHKVEETRSILVLWRKLWRYDNVVLGIAYTEPTLLEDILNVTNIPALQSYVSGGILTFLCILTFLKDHLADFSKLRELIRIDTVYTDGLQSWFDGIHILRKPEKYEKATYEIEGDIGMVKPGGFDINLDKMDTGRSYFFNYGNSKYKARKVNGELQLFEVG